jgi:hypothetical protein
LPLSGTSLTSTKSPITLLRMTAQLAPHFAPSPRDVIIARSRFSMSGAAYRANSKHDGPLTGYDFERLQRAPYRLVMSSCDSAVLAPATATSLITLGAG